MKNSSSTSCNTTITKRIVTSQLLRKSKSFQFTPCSGNHAKIVLIKFFLQPFGYYHPSREERMSEKTVFFFSDTLLFFFVFCSFALNVDCFQCTLIFDLAIGVNVVCALLRVATRIAVELGSVNSSHFSTSYKCVYA